MSDAGVLRALEELEAMIEACVPEPEWLDAWRLRMEAEKATAEHGPGWEAIRHRGHELARVLDARVAALRVDQHVLRQEMGMQANGIRALQAYGGARG